MATNNALNNASSPFTVSSGNLVVTTGNMSTSAGSITAATTLTASSGDVTVTSGNLLLPMTTSTIGQIKIIKEGEINAVEQLPSILIGHLEELIPEVA